jgi:hypothetical protein
MIKVVWSARILVYPLAAIFLILPLIATFGTRVVRAVNQQMGANVALIISSDNAATTESDLTSKIYPKLKELIGNMKTTDIIYIFAHLKEMDASTAAEIENATAPETQSIDAINNEMKRRKQSAQEEFEKEFGVEADQLLQSRDSAAMNRYQQILKEYGADLDSKNLMNEQIFNLSVIKDNKTLAIQKQHYPEIFARAKQEIATVPDIKLMGTGRYWGFDTIFMQTQVGRISDLAKIPDVVGLEDEASGEAYMGITFFEVLEPTWCPWLLSPSNGSAGQSINHPSFSWKAFNDTIKYQFALSTDSGMSNMVNEAEVSANSYEYDGALNYSTYYFWRVRALEPELSEWSATFTFQTAAAPPKLPEIQSQNAMWPPILIAMVIVALVTSAGLVTWLIISKKVN